MSMYSQFFERWKFFSLCGKTSSSSIQYTSWMEIVTPVLGSVLGMPDGQKISWRISLRVALMDSIDPTVWRNLA